MEKLVYHEVQSRNEKITIDGKSGSVALSGQAQLNVNGNNNYKSLVGVFLLITDSEGQLHTGKADVSITTTSGQVIVPEQPYACIRPSFNEKPSDRIIPVDSIKGFGHDFRFQATIHNTDINPKTFEVTAVCYFTNR